MIKSGDLSLPNKISVSEKVLIEKVRNIGLAVFTEIQIPVAGVRSEGGEMRGDRNINIWLRI